MIDFLDWITANVVTSLGLAVVVLVLSPLLRRRPAVLHGLWLLVLVKLVTPPLIPVAWPAAWPRLMSPASTTSDPDPMPSSHSDPVGSAADTDGECHRRSIDDEVETATPSIVMGRARGDTTNKTESGFASIHEGDRSPPDSPAPSPTSAVNIPWRSLAFALWLAGSVTLAAVTLRRVIRFRRSLAMMTCAEPALRLRAASLGRTLDLDIVPTVVIAPGPTGPLLWGLGKRTAIVLPAAMIEASDPSSVDALIVHELAHYRRHDHVVRVVELAVAIVFWWNPIVWFARRELHRAEEDCCDAWVVATLPEHGRAYATALVECASLVSRSSSLAVATGLDPTRSLKRRIAMIMRPTSSARLGSVSGMTLALFALAVLPLVPLAAQDAANDEASSVAPREKRLPARKVRPVDAVSPRKNPLARLFSRKNPLAGSVASDESANPLSELATTSEASAISGLLAGPSGPGVTPSASPFGLVTSSPLGPVGVSNDVIATLDSVIENLAAFATDDARLDREIRRLVNLRRRLATRSSASRTSNFPATSPNRRLGVRSTRTSPFSGPNAPGRRTSPFGKSGVRTDEASPLRKRSRPSRGPSRFGGSGSPRGAPGASAKPDDLLGSASVTEPSAPESTDVLSVDAGPTPARKTPAPRKSIGLAVSDANDPVSVDQPIAYRLEVTNRSRTSAEDIEVSAVISSDAEFLTAGGPTSWTRDGNRVVFDSLANLDANKTAVWTINVQPTKKGRVRLKVTVKEKDLTFPIKNIVSTRIN